MKKLILIFSSILLISLGFYANKKLDTTEERMVNNLSEYKSNDWVH